MAAPCGRCGKRSQAIKKIIRDTSKGRVASAARKAAVVGSSMATDARRLAASRLGFRKSK